MSDRTNLVYRYDGTYDGLMCCVFESFRAKELPASIAYFDSDQETLFKTKYIDTTPEMAQRVKSAIPVKISVEAQELIQKAFLTCLKDKERMILKFLILGFKHGAKATEFSTNDVVHKLDKAVQHLMNEAAHLRGFLRFTDYGQFLASVIHPKNSVLPLISSHFCDRFSSENFIIFDRPHKLAFIYDSSGTTKFMEVFQLDLPDISDDEDAYRQLWKHFYNSIAVEGRINPKLRRTLMPNRFWEDMPEMEGKTNRIP